MFIILVEKNTARFAHKIISMCSCGGDVRCCLVVCMMEDKGHRGGGKVMARTDDCGCLSDMFRMIRSCDQ